MKKGPQKTGTVAKDYAGIKELDFPLDTQDVRLDQDAQSIGVDLNNDFVKITRILLKTDVPTDTITKERLTLSVSFDNTDEAESWTIIPAEDWILLEVDEETLEIRLREPVPGRYIKVHCFVDDRDEVGATRDQSTFGNDNTQILSVYYTVDKMYEKFEYDDSGNRTVYEKRVPGELQEEEIETITRYPNSNRVMTDNDYGYVWDDNGNLVMKGKDYTDNESSIDISATVGEVWQYEWDKQNRLIKVYKSDAGINSLLLLTEYTYDYRGYRVKKILHTGIGTETTYYAFGTSGEVLYKENITTLVFEEFVYIGGYYFAEVKGTTDTSETTTYFYITDTLGSVTAMTDEDGNIVWSNEYLAFGIEWGSTGFIDAPNIYAGHEFDEDVQLYYARARWYDSEMGRFVSIDPARDGANWFAYAGNNPLRFIDPSGLASVNQVPRSTNAKESGSRGDYYHLSKQDIDQLKDRTDLEWRAIEQYTELLGVINTVNDNKIPQQWGGGLTPDNISGISQGKTGFSITTESGYYYSFDKETFELTEFGEQGAIPTNDELLIVGLVQIGRKLVKAGIKKIVSKFGKESIDDIFREYSDDIVRENLPGKFTKSDMALGVHEHLQTFKGKALIGTDLPGNTGLMNEIKNAMMKTVQSGGKLRFNLSGVNINEALSSVSDLFHSYTSQELRFIINNPQLLKNTVFYFKNAVIPTAKVVGGL